MTLQRYRFGEFLLDPAQRRLLRNGEPVELSDRYLDALTLLVREPGSLVTKERFLEEVWRGVPVTDEALTQCIRTLRRQLGDAAAAPAFIETVPKHGYRFIAPVAPEQRDTPPHRPATAEAPFATQVAAVAIGGGAAGVIGGIVYGFAASAQAGGGSALSILLVLLALTTGIALLGAAGVGLGVALAGATRLPPLASRLVGGAVGGLITGAVVKLVGLDAFGLLFGAAPAGITGAGEGALLGGAVGLGLHLAARAASPARGIALAAIAGGAAGALIALLGGRLMAGSLAALASSFPQSRLRLDAIGALFGDPGFGLVAQTMTATAEGALFAACIAAALSFARVGRTASGLGQRLRAPEA